MRTVLTFLSAGLGSVHFVAGVLVEVLLSVSLSETGAEVCGK